MCSVSLDCVLSQGRIIYYLSKCLFPIPSEYGKVRWALQGRTGNWMAEILNSSSSANFAIYFFLSRCVYSRSWLEEKKWIKKKLTWRRYLLIWQVCRQVKHVSATYWFSSPFSDMRERGGREPLSILLFNCILCKAPMGAANRGFWQRYKAAPKLA